MVKKNKWKIIITLIVILSLIVIATSSISLSTIGLDKSEVWVPKFSNARCEPTRVSDINTYIVREDNSLMTKFSDTKLFTPKNYLIYKCGYGNLETGGDSKAYTNLCTFSAIYNGKGSLKTVPAVYVYECKSEYSLINQKISPSKSDLCRSLASSSTETSFTYNSQDLAGVNGVFSPQGKYTTLAFGLNDGFLQDTELSLRVSAPNYQLKVTEGNNAAWTGTTGCNLNQIKGLTGVLPSTVKPSYTNIFKSFGEYLAFGQVINWIWAYEPIRGGVLINHNSLGEIYVTGVGSYIKIEEVDGIKIAYETNKKTSSMIQCMPNLPGCDSQAKLIIEPTKIECSEFKGLEQGSRTLTYDGRSCVYNCVNGKPSYSQCITVTDSTCPTQGEVYDIKTGKCVIVDTSNPGIENKPSLTLLDFINNNLKWILGAVILTSLIIVGGIALSRRK